MQCDASLALQSNVRYPMANYHFVNNGIATSSAHEPCCSTIAIRAPPLRAMNGVLKTTPRPSFSHSCSFLHDGSLPTSVRSCRIGYYDLRCSPAPLVTSVSLGSVASTLEVFQIHLLHINSLSRFKRSSLCALDSLRNPSRLRETS